MGDIFLAHFGPLAPIEHHLNATAYLSIVTMSIALRLQCTHLLRATSSRIMHHVTKLKSSQTGFLKHDNELTLLKWHPQSPDLNPIEHFWDVVEREIHIMDVHPTNLQQLCDAIRSIWTKISEECFQHLVESMPRRIKVVLKAKGGSTMY